MKAMATQNGRPRNSFLLASPGGQRTAQKIHRIPQRSCKKPAEHKVSDICTTKHGADVKRPPWTEVEIYDGTRTTSKQSTAGIRSMAEITEREGS
jgi:hypothetical protein